MPSDPKLERRDTVRYSARDGYADYAIGVDYERVRFSGVLGGYRRRREEAAVRAVLKQIPNGVSILDCPCGTGRWWPLLATRAREITAIDISPGMLRHASERATRMAVPVNVTAGEAEEIPLLAGAVDYAFSFALMKHLPRPVQYRVLSELARVSRLGVICTLGVLGHVSYEVWRRRRSSESYPLLMEELQWMAAAAGLRVEWMARCTTPIGVERIVRFSRLR
jgi:ubiquinone/menaquinone biosynthesis C-methylase UbiE